MKKNNWKFSLILCFFLVSCEAYTDDGNILGIWDKKPQQRMTMCATFSWGENPYSIDSVIIDMRATKPYFSVNDGKFIIKKYSHRKDIIELYGYYYDAPSKNEKIIIHIVDCDSLWFDDYSKYPWSLEVGNDNIYKRVLPSTKYEPYLADESP